MLRLSHRIFLTCFCQSCCVTGPPANRTARRCWPWSMAFPAGVTIETDSIDVELRRRQGGYGRGGRQRIETDTRRHPDRRLAGHDARQPDRAASHQQGLQARTARRPRPAAARAWRSDRGDQVPGLDPRRAGTGQCPRDDGPRRRRCAGQAIAPRSSASRALATSSNSAASASNRAGGTLAEQRAARRQRNLLARSRARCRGQST